MSTSKKFIAFIAGLIFPFVIAAVMGLVYLILDFYQTSAILRFVQGVIFLGVSFIIWRWHQKESLKYFLTGEALVAIFWLVDFILP